ncbi:MAG: DHA2 family efflux MFS transporter permease subunit [Verrucomicrobia bacterium]|nr:DHA2 family efflux MFS transporter permease subunit [Verrucomicrobiota bacterium]
MNGGPLSTGQKVLLFIAIALATFMMVLDYSIANIAIPYIAGDLAVSTDEGTYVITSFAVGNAIGLIMTGWLTKRVGQIKLIVIATLLFTVFSLTCGLSPSLSFLVINRFIQGLVSGPMVPLSQSLLISFGTIESRARDLAFWSTIVVTAPVVGPILGGYISDYYSWSWIFYINIPVGLFCAAVFWFMIRDRESPTNDEPADYGGILLLAGGVTCLQIFLDKGQTWDWWNSDIIRCLAVGTVVCFTYLMIQEKWYAKPLIDLRLFKIPSFTLSIVCLLFSYGIYFGTVVLVPLWLQEYMGYTPEKAGLAVAALGIAPIFLTLFTPTVIKKLGNVLTLLLGFSLFCVGCFYSAFFTTEVDLNHIALARFIFGFGIVYYVPPLFGISVQDVPTAELPSATGIFHFCRAMVGAIGTSIFTTLWIRRTYFHHERIGESLTRFNPFTPQAQDPKSLALLNRLLDKEAAMMAINEAFYIMGWTFVGLVLLLAFWYFRTRNQPPAPVVQNTSVE